MADSVADTTPSVDTTVPPTMDVSAPTIDEAASSAATEVPPPMTPPPKTNKFLASFASSTTAVDSAFKNLMTKTVSGSRSMLETTKAGSKQVMDKTGQAVTKSVENSKQLMDKTGHAVTKSVESSRHVLEKVGQSSRRSVTGLKHVVDEKVIVGTKSAWDKTMEQFAKTVGAGVSVMGKGPSASMDHEELVGLPLFSSKKKGGEEEEEESNVANYKKDFDPFHLRVDSLDDALSELTHLIDTVNPPHIKWECQMTPFLNDASHQDLYCAFLQWSREEILDDELKEEEEVVANVHHNNDDDEKKEAKDETAATQDETPPSTAAAAATDAALSHKLPTKMVYNVTKAFERLESYVNWMEDHRVDLSTPTKVTADSIQAAAKAWGMECHHDRHGRFVWFLDFGKIDMAAIKKGGGTITLQDSLRYIVWASHVMLFDQQAQANGMVVVQSMGFKGIMESMAPLDMAQKLDKFTMGKLLSPYVVEACFWFLVYPTTLSHCG
jgi:hypothetical protein